MKRILMAMVVAGMLAVAIPLAPVQVQEVEARPDCVAYATETGDLIDISDVVQLSSEMGDDPQFQGRVQLYLNNFGETC